MTIKTELMKINYYLPIVYCPLPLYYVGLLANFECSSSGWVGFIIFVHANSFVIIHRGCA